MNNIREATLEDIFYLSLNLREADKDEIYASTGNRLYYKCLLDSYNDSKKCLIWTINETPALIMGVVDNGTKGIGWAMGTDEILKERKFFLENASKYIQHFSEGYEMVYNYVYIENKVHINWLRRAGFTFNEDPIELKNGEKFLYFYKENKYV